MMKRTSERVFAILLAGLLFCLLGSSCIASPGCEALCSSQNGQHAVSLFLSNFAETGLPAYDETTDAATMAACIFKHIELNYTQFDESDVLVGTDDNGRKYLYVSGKKLGDRAADLFDVGLNPDFVPGYRDGRFCVTADHAGDPITLFAAPTGPIEYTGDRNYEVNFTVFRANGGVKNELYTAYWRSDPPGSTMLYTGRAVFTYRGDPDATEFSTADLHLLRWTVDGAPTANSGAFGDNVPYTPVFRDSTPPTDLPGSGIPAPTDGEAGSAPVQPITPIPYPGDEPGGGAVWVYVLIAVGALLIAAACGVTVYFIYRKK